MTSVLVLAALVLAVFGVVCALFAIITGLTVGISTWAWPLAIFGLVGCGAQLVWWARQ